MPFAFSEIRRTLNIPNFVYFSYNFISYTLSIKIQFIETHTKVNTKYTIFQIQKKECSWSPTFIKKFQFVLISLKTVTKKLIPLLWTVGQCAKTEIYV